MRDLLPEHPARSLLFVPGNRPEWFHRAVDSGADGLIIDLQDAVPAAERPAARDAVADFLRSRAGHPAPLTMVRVSPTGTAQQELDLWAVVGPGLHGVVLPMVRRPDDVVSHEGLLEHLEGDRGLPHRLRIMPLLETAEALVRCFDIASATDRTAYLGGATAAGGDLARSLGFQWTPEGLETLYLRSHALLHARAAGVGNPVSGMWGDVADLAGLRDFATSTRRLGYRGMMVIHPSHVPVVHEVFSPTAQEIADWQAIIAQVEERQSAGIGASTYDGRLVDSAHAATARGELQRARLLGLL